MNRAARKGDWPARLIAGSGRSGTTWILDVLAEANGLRPIFEPLHPVVASGARDLAYRYLRRDERCDALEEHLRAAFDGTLRSVWTDYRVRPDRLRPGLSTLTSFTRVNELRRRWRKLYRQYRRFRKGTARQPTLVKAIRANLMLGWLSERFDVHCVLVLRHPGAVIESQLRLGGDDWEPFHRLSRYREDKTLLQDWLFKYNAALQRVSTPAEALAALWCIENQPALERLDGGDYTVIFYENLLHDPDREWPRITDALGLGQVPGAAALREPSQQASKAYRAGKLDAAHGAGWQGRLASTEAQAIGRVLDEMGVTVYGMNDPMPNGDALPAPRAGTR